MRYTHRGGNIPYFRGSIYQRGYGLGGIFKGLARSPILRKALINVGRKTLETGGRIIGDVVGGKNIKQSIKQRSKESAKQVFHDFLDGASRNSSTPSSAKSSIKPLKTKKSVSRKRTTKLNRSSRSTIKKKRRHVSDIFD